MNPSLLLVYILIPVHNRKVTTLACLNTLQRNGDMDRYRILVIDDGSTDGTAEAISKTYPEVTILSGDGNLWWTGAIAKGMEYAFKYGADYFIWLNDDTLPLANTLPQLVHHCSSRTKRIATAQCYTTNRLINPTYGGQLKHLLSIRLFATPQGKKISCDCMSGNLVCFPRSIIDEIGYPPAERLPHCRADIVYTLMAKRVGYDLQVIGDAIAVSPLNPFDEGWLYGSISTIQRWRQLPTLKSNVYPPTYWVYCNEVFGFIGPALFIFLYAKLLVYTLIRLFIPLDWLKIIKAYKDQYFWSNWKI